MAAPETVAPGAVPGRVGEHAASTRAPAVDPWRPLDLLFEEEILSLGGRQAAVTVFLAGARCPFSCVFCDLDRYTLRTTTPVGALPSQIELALRRIHRRGLEPAVTRLKLYNASNFFEPRAVPDLDAERIARRLRGFARVVVESHPRLLGDRCRRFAARLRQGCDTGLEVAMGLEVADDRVLERLRKGATLDDFRRAARFLHAEGIALRLFVLVGAPFVDRERQVVTTVDSLRFACELGAERVSLIPVRPERSELRQLAVDGSFEPPDLELVERCLEGCVEELAAAGGPLVTLDRWDLDRLLVGRRDGAARLAALEALERRGLELVAAGERSPG